MPLHPDAAKALERLRNIPRIDRLVFPVDSDAKNKGPVVSKAFADLCGRAGLTVTVERAGIEAVKNKWTLHDLRRKCNTDLRNLGASPKERATLIGHRSTDVNEEHYEAIQPNRERELIDGLRSFGSMVRPA
jgi:integrase